MTDSWAGSFGMSWGGSFGFLVFNLTEELIIVRQPSGSFSGRGTLVDYRKASKLGDTEQPIEDAGPMTLASNAMLGGGARRTNIFAR